MENQQIQSILVDGLEQLGIAPSSQQISALINFSHLLLKWNKVYNLTAVKDIDKIARLHLLDSLSLHAFIAGSTRLIDVGSGGGLPGIPLAIFNPDVQFVLLDSNIKKTRFVKQAAIELNLKNVEVVHSRVENYRPSQRFDCLTTRAFSTIANTLPVVAHLLSDHATLLFMKSKTAEQEASAVGKNFEKEIVELQVPGIDAPRSLVILRRVN